MSEEEFSRGSFIDDNFDGTTSETALATLTNSWALLVDPLNPAASPLSRFTVPFGDPGIETPGVDILMESRGLGIAAGNPVENPTPLTNDDYGTRQFLYPSTQGTQLVPEVAETRTLLLIGLGTLVLLGYGRRRRKRDAYSVTRGSKRLSEPHLASLQPTGNSLRSFLAAATQGAETLALCVKVSRV
jgi:hypothetical protein